MDEKATREALTKAKQDLQDFGLGDTGLCKAIDMVLDFPSGPVLTRKSGALGTETPKFFTDFTFQEAMQLPMAKDDKRSVLLVFLEGAADAVKRAESGGLKRRSES
jgi:hypothetical protein